MDQEKIGARRNEIEHDALPLRRLAGQGIVAGQTAGLEVARSGSAMSALCQKQTLATSFITSSARRSASERDLIPPQRDPNIARQPPGEVDDLKSNLVSASFEVLFPKVVEFLWIAGKCFFPARLALIYGSSTIGT